MLHIVQVVFAGTAEVPRVFLDRGAAESAFVELVQKFWRQSYAAYCQRSGVAMDHFASAKDFLETLDLSEKSKLNYWTVSPENADSGLDIMEDMTGIRRRGEEVGRVIEQLAQRSVAFREELAGLLGGLDRLLAEYGDQESPSAGGRTAEPEEDAAISPSPVAEKEREEDAEKYATKEWKTFVATIMNMCGGNRSEFPPLPRPAWRQEVYSNATSLEYWDWVAAKIDRYKEAAENAGYAVMEDPDSPGHYRFRTPEGATDETSCYSEWEAWCHAGMQMTGKPEAGQG